MDLDNTFFQWPDERRCRGNARGLRQLSPTSGRKNAGDNFIRSQCRTSLAENALCLPTPTNRGLCLRSKTIVGVGRQSAFSASEVRHWDRMKLSPAFFLPDVGDSWRRPRALPRHRRSSGHWKKVLSKSMRRPDEYRPKFCLLRGRKAGDHL